MLPYLSANNSSWWDISPIDGRFLMLRRDATNRRTKLVMVENFFEELREQVRASRR